MIKQKVELVLVLDWEGTTEVNNINNMVGHYITMIISDNFL